MRRTLIPIIGQSCDTIRVLSILSVSQENEISTDDFEYQSKCTLISYVDS